MGRVWQTDRPARPSASRCCACGAGRGEARQALVGRLAGNTIWLCGECATHDAGRQAFLAAYAALAEQGPRWRAGVQAQPRPERE